MNHDPSSLKLAKIPVHIQENILSSKWRTLRSSISQHIILQQKFTQANPELTGNKQKLTDVEVVQANPTFNT